MDEIVNLDAGIREIRKLHPTLKKCRCGFVGSKTKLYKHFDEMKLLHRTSHVNSFFDHHGEVPINEDEG